MAQKNMLSRFIPIRSSIDLTVGNAPLFTGFRKALIWAWGGGGGGAACYGTGNISQSVGGGGGAFVAKTIVLVPSQVISFTIGSGGVGGQVGSTTYGNCTDGGDTVVSVSGSWSMTAGGGKKGTAGTNTSGTTISGSAGGTGSGDYDYTFAGGRSGQAKSGGGTIPSHGTGGGASGSPWGTGGRGGDIDQSSVAPYLIKITTGGGAWGGKHGGDASARTNNINTGGASVWQDAASNTYTAGDGSAYSLLLAFTPWRGYEGIQNVTDMSGSQGRGVETSGPFTGGGATGKAGVFGGGGGAYTATGDGVAGAGGFCGGGGGAFVWPAEGLNCYGGAGGRGFACIWLL